MDSLHSTRTVACRGCWMPRANEVLGCPQTLENIFDLSRKISFLTTFFVTLFTKIRSLDAPPKAASCPGYDTFRFFFVMYLHFFKENWPLGCPPGWMPGPSHRPHPPLHATAPVTNFDRTLLRGKRQRENIGHPHQHT